MMVSIFLFQENQNISNKEISKKQLLYMHMPLNIPNPLIY